MGRSYERNEFGTKDRVYIEIRGEGRVERSFRNKGEAIDYLKKEGYTKEFINRFVTISKE